jgi:hypothetical protein
MWSPRPPGPESSVTTLPNEPPLESEPEPRSRSWIWYWIAITSFVSYPLSVAPVLWICKHFLGGPPPYAVQLLYRPLEILYFASPMVRAFYDAYFKLLDVR